MTIVPTNISFILSLERDFFDAGCGSLFAVLLDLKSHFIVHFVLHIIFHLLGKFFIICINYFHYKKIAALCLGK